MQDEYEELTPEQEAKELAKREWQKKAYHCAMSGNKHEFIPMAYELTPKSKHVSMLMCTRCFQHINVSEAFEHRG